MKAARIMLIALMLLLIACAVHEQFGNGYVLIVYHTTRIEMTVWVAVLLWLLITLVVGVTVKLLRGMAHWPAAWRQKRSSKRSEKLNTNRKKALRHMLLGDYTAAKQCLSRTSHPDALSWVDHVVVTYITYSMESDVRAGDRCLEQLLASDFRHDPLLMYLFKAVCQWHAGKYHYMVDTLTHAQLLGHHHPRLLWWLQRGYGILKDHKARAAILIPHWTQCSRWMSDDERRACISQVGCYSLQQVTSEQQLNVLWKQLPTSWRKQADVIRGYAQAWDRLGKMTRAADVLTQQVRSGDLKAAVEYARLKHTCLTQALTTGETWLNRHPEHPQVLLCVSILSARQQWWQKAFHYAQRCLEQAQDPEVLYELGHWFELMNKHSEALSCYRKSQSGLLNAGMNRSEPAH